MEMATVAPPDSNNRYRNLNILCKILGPLPRFVTKTSFVEVADLFYAFLCLGISVRTV